MPPFVIGLDIGGTFTDLALLDPEAPDIALVKTPTTPGDLWAGARAALAADAAGRGIGLPELLARTRKLRHRHHQCPLQPRWGPRGAHRHARLRGPDPHHAGQGARGRPEPGGEAALPRHHQARAH